MAEVAVALTEISASVPMLMATWSPLANGDTGSPVELPAYADQTVTIEGTFSVGGSCTLKGSNDGTNYYALTDPQGNAITMTSARIEAVTETPRFVKPHVTAGDGSTAIQVRLIARRVSR